MIGGGDISEPYSEHNVGAPVVAPNVLDVPSTMLYAALDIPVLCFIDARHEVQENWQDVANCEVGDEHFYQSVVAFLLAAVDEQILKFLQLLNIAGQLYHRHQRNHNAHVVV